MVVATYFYYEKVRRTMRTAVASNLPKSTQMFEKCDSSNRQ